MQALIYSDSSCCLRLVKDHPRPAAKQGEAVIRIILAGICSTDLQIIRGYVPGFNGVLGHEFVGRVESCPSRPELEQARVVGEINCNDACFCCSDAIFQRNHAPNRSVLGIINKDGCMAEYITLPASNLHVVPDQLSDSEAAFAEPLAAACRILEQGLAREPNTEVAVIGDGKLGLMVAQLLAAEGSRVTLIGRHAEKMAKVQGLARAVLVPMPVTCPCDNTDAIPGAVPAAADPLAELEGCFQLVVDASGSPDGVLSALRLTRAMGTLLLKSTVSTKQGGSVPWAQVANDIVVNEKVLLGSRCGPMDVALSMMVKHASIRSLLGSMVSRVFPLSEAEAAMQHAQEKGVLKVLLA